jgi:hypothetical protein
MRMRQDVLASGSYISSNDRRLHFGLGDATDAGTAEIHWPDGTKETVKLPAVDRIYTITEGQGITGALCGGKECAEDVCPPGWTLAGRLHRIMTWQPTSSSMATQRKIDAGLGLMIAMQWFLLGAFPLVRNPSWRRWWGEPGSFITVCAVLAGFLALFHPVEGAARLPASLAMLVWFLWFGLLVWRILSFTWRLVVRRPVAAG